MYRQTRRHFASISPRLRLVAGLSFAFVALSFPAVVSLAVDVLVVRMRAHATVRVVVTTAAFAYTVACPLVLLKYMSGLKESLVRLLQPLMCCCDVFYT